MNTFEGLPVGDYLASLHQTGKRKYAWKIMDEYFEFYGADRPADILWTLVTIAMKSDSEEINGRERENFICFYEYTLLLIEAGHHLCVVHPKPK